jgi:glucosamine--fructose-6-phosphate aminotransferase (isomerizing)
MVFKDDHLTQLIGNILQVKERGATTIIVTNLPKISDVIDLVKIDYLIQLPPQATVLAGLMAVPPLQMLCYFTALERGINPDKQIFDAIDFEQTALSASFDSFKKGTNIQ